jgi:hypothetical protein
MNKGGRDRAMTSFDLAKSYLKKAVVRRDVLDVFHEKGAYSKKLSLKVLNTSW